MTNNEIFAALRPHILNVTGVSECILADPNGMAPEGPYASLRPRQSIRERGQANIVMRDGENDTIVYEVRAQIVADCDVNFFRGEAMRYAELLKECHKRPDVSGPCGSWVLVGVGPNQYKTSPRCKPVISKNGHR